MQSYKNQLTDDLTENSKTGRSKPIFFNKVQKQPQKISTNSYLKSIFVLAFTLIVFQSVSLLFFSNYILNILLFGLIMMIYINKQFSRLVLKFLLLVNIFSILMDLGFIFIHFQDIFSHKYSNLIEERAVLKINNLCPQFIPILTGIIFFTFIGKILLGVFLGMQILENSNSSKEISIFGHKIQLKCLTNQQPGFIHQALVKSFVN